MFLQNRLEPFCKITRTRARESIAMSDPREPLLQTWESLFKDEALKQNHSPEFIDRCLEYASKLRQNNMPVIFNVSHFSEIVGCERLTEHYRCIAKQYATYNIRKRNGKGEREINAPRSELKDIQKWIYKNILLRDASVRGNVYSFLPKGYNNRGHISIKENAEPHAGHIWLINIDLKDFFGSIRIERVQDYFRNIGFIDEVADLLATLCCYKCKLPQGASTSPMLSNIIASNLDDTMTEISAAYNATYTRYADDMTFSGIEKEIIPINIIYDAINKCGFKPNYKKTKIKLKGTRQMVTGLTTTNSVNVPKAYRKEVWRELHFLKKFGFESHLKKHQEIIGKEIGFYKQWLLGRIMYIRSVNETCGNKMLDEFNSVGML